MNTGFGQSWRGSFLLSYLGTPNIEVSHGGNASGMPVTTEAISAAPASCDVDLAAASLMLTVDDLKAALAAPDAALLDVRDVDESGATRSSPYGSDFCPRKGRIPGAVWIE